MGARDRVYEEFPVRAVSYLFASIVVVRIVAADVFTFRSLKIHVVLNVLNNLPTSCVSEAIVNN